MNDRPLEESVRSVLRSAAPQELPPQLLHRVSAISTTAIASPRRLWGSAALWATVLTVSAIAVGVVATNRPTSLFVGASQAPKPSPSAAAPGPLGTAVASVCGEVPGSYKGVFVPYLTCNEAMSAALRSLPKQHPEIVRLEFGFGDYCRPTVACATGIDLLNGYVLVTYASGPRSLVSVREASVRSGVSVTSTEALP